MSSNSQEFEEVDEDEDYSPDSDEVTDDEDDSTTDYEEEDDEEYFTGTSNEDVDVVEPLSQSQDHQFGMINLGQIEFVDLQDFDDDDGDGGEEAESEDDSDSSTTTTDDTVEENQVPNQLEEQQPPAELVPAENENHAEIVNLVENPNQAPNTHEQISNNDNANDNPHLEERDGNEPANKIPRLELTQGADDEQGFTCQICYEPFANSGPHRVCCLKCGHVFGRECLERWLLTAKRCAFCNTKARKADIRPIYVNNLKAVDATEIERLKVEKNILKNEKNNSDYSNELLRIKDGSQKRTISRLQDEIESLKACLAASSAEAAFHMLSSSSSINPLPYHNPNAADRRCLRITHLKRFDIPEGQARIAAYSQSQNMLVVSHAMGGFYGIKKISTMDWTLSEQSLQLHAKPIKDMTFSLEQLPQDLVLTVGMDKQAMIIDARNNKTVTWLNTQSPLWSCCWNEMDQYTFYLGAANGEVTFYDIRSPKTTLGKLALPTADINPVARLKFVPVTYQKQSSVSSGVLIQKFNSLWFAEFVGGCEVKYHQLLLDAPFANVDYDKRSSKILVSGRPRQGIGARHLVCDLRKTYQEREGQFKVHCDVTHDMTSGSQDYATLCRSALFSTVDGRVCLAANGDYKKFVRIWDISDLKRGNLAKICGDGDMALDIMPGRRWGKDFVGVVSEKGMDVHWID